MGPFSFGRYLACGLMLRPGGKGSPGESGGLLLHLEFWDD